MSWIVYSAQVLYAVGSAVTTAVTYAASAAAPRDGPDERAMVTHARHAAPSQPPDAAAPWGALPAPVPGWTASFADDPLFALCTPGSWAREAREWALTWLVYLCRVAAWGGTSDADVCHTLSPGLPAAYWTTQADACRAMLWYTLRMRAEVTLHALCCIALAAAGVVAARAAYAWLCAWPAQRAAAVPPAKRSVASGALSPRHSQHVARNLRPDDAAPARRASHGTAGAS
uniref:Uncharacterized protein n=1 Tax=viral metagenome TaxID=1070528 RepID=A0A6C0AUJ9_9ZZZZ